MTGKVFILRNQKRGIASLGEACLDMEMQALVVLRASFRLLPCIKLSNFNRPLQLSQHRTIDRSEQFSCHWMRSSHSSWCEFFHISALINESSTKWT